MNHRFPAYATSLTLLAIAGCGGSSATPAGSASPAGSATSNPSSAYLNTTYVAGAIEQSILRERHIHSIVSCQRHIPKRKGWHFVCFATTRQGQTPFVVTEVNDQGYVTYVGK